MNSSLPGSLALLLLCASVALCSENSKLTPAGHFGELPIYFEPNQGQSNAAVKFSARGSGMRLALTDQGAVLHVQHSTGERALVTMTPAGGQTAAEVTASGRLPGISNYFIGSDPKNWHAG